MSEITKVFLAGVGGAFIAQWAGPKITPHLPASLQTPTMAQFTNAAIAGGSAAAAYWALGEVGVKG